jgi:hypothetical protein
MKLKLKEGTTSKIATVFVQDSSSTTGAGLAGLVFNSASLTGYWIAEGDATATALTLVTMTAGTWVSAGFVEVDSTNLPGIYQVGLPDVVVDATSEGSVVVMLKGATNMAPCVMEIELDGMDYRAGVVPTVTSVTGAVGSVTGAVGSVTGHTAQTGDSFAIVNGASGSVATKTVVDAIPTTAMRGTDSAYTGTPPTAAAIADQVWDEVITTSAHNVANSAGKRLRQSTGLLQAESAVNDPGAAATTTAFNTDLTEADNFWNDSLVVFTSGTLSGQSKPILTYTQANGAIVLDEALTSAPADNDEFTIYSTHIHSVSQIADGVWDEATAGHVAVGSTGLALTSIFTTAMTESYAADGVAPTPAQSLFLIQQALTEVAIVSTTETIKKLDGSTAAATLTLDDASSPTSKTRAT